MSDSARHKGVLWCQEQQELDSDWRNIIFRDESWFELSTASRNHWVWRHHCDYGDDVCYTTQAPPKKIMVWGAIGYNFRSPLHFVEGTVHGDYYFDEILVGSVFLEAADKAFGYNNWRLQHDNARPHIKKDILTAMDYLDIKHRGLDYRSIDRQPKHLGLRARQ
jgi:hypothetical protein